jgi:hypothetical protein
MWPRPPLNTEARGAALRPWMGSLSPTSTQYPGQTYPQVMDFHEYDQRSGGSSMHSPTVFRRRESFQPTTVRIEEVTEQAMSGIRRIEDPRFR